MGALQELLASHGVRRAGQAERSDPARWRLAELSGRLVELSGRGASSALTVAIGLVLEVQRAGELVGWVSAAAAPFFPPDLVESGVDLEALVVVRAPGTAFALRAADRLLRSAGFGLVVLDLGPVSRLPLPAQTRLAGLAQRHDSLLLCLTEKEATSSSLGPLVSLHAWAGRRRLHEGHYACEVRILKDKRRGPGWVHREVCRGPAGLR